MIKLIVALGNPGPEYVATRHNAGWRALDSFAGKTGANWKNEAKFKSRMAEAETGQRKIWLLKPMTFMNLSGEAVQLFMHFHTLKLEELLLVHDEVAFESGKVKLSLGGGSGGHNGVGDIIERLGAEEFWRLRLGVGPRNPLLTLTEWVLGPLSQPEQSFLESQQLIDMMNCVVDKGPALAQNALNLS